MKSHLADRIRRGESINPPLSWLLSAGTIINRVGMWFRKQRPLAMVDAYVVSVGNITAGGTGKTPAVIRYAKHYVEQGHKVGILTRGYGTPSEHSIVVSADIDPDEYCDKLGDEPAVILRQVPEVIVVKGKDRIHAAQVAVNEHACEVLILDDGYQFLHLARNENILLIDSQNPYGNGKLIPRGFLREPLREIHRATHCVVTRVTDDLDRAEIINAVRSYAPDIQIEWTQHTPTRLLHPLTGVEQSLDIFSGQEVVAACAIGNPEAFTRTLEDLGMTVIETHAFPDHDTISTEVFKSKHPVIITEKDAVRIKHPPDNLFVLEVELETLETTTPG